MILSTGALRIAACCIKLQWGRIETATLLIRLRSGMCMHFLTALSIDVLFRHALGDNFLKLDVIDEFPEKYFLLLELS